MRRASVVLSGGRLSERSLKTSTNWPPVPNSSTGPNWASRLLPTISSYPSPLLIMGCTVTPWKCSAPTFSVTEVRMRRATAPVSDWVFMVWISLDGGILSGRRRSSQRPAATAAAARGAGETMLSRPDGPALQQVRRHVPQVEWFAILHLHPQHLVKVAVVHLPHPAHAEGRATHQALDRGGIEAVR